MKEFIKQANEKGYNCNQKVVSYFIDDEKVIDGGALYGSGMRMGGVCGAYTGALTVLGIKADNPRELLPAFDKAFRKEVGALECKDILGKNPVLPGNREALQKEGTMPKKCDHAVTAAIRILEELL